ncbi:spindle pole body protein pcp1 [Biomphalaria glabrata]
MRPHKQQLIITLNLEVLQNVRHNLLVLEESIRTVLEKGEKWLDDDDDAMTFVQMNQFLVNENSRCLQTCRDIASEKEVVNTLNTDVSQSKETLATTLASTSYAKEERTKCHTDNSQLEVVYKTIPITTENCFFELKDNLTSLIKSLSKKIESLQKKNTEQDNKIKEIEWKLTQAENTNKDQEKYMDKIIAEVQSVAESKTNSKLNEFIIELHKASEFIQNETDTLSEKVKNCEGCNETILKRQENIENNFRVNIDSITKKLESCFDLVAENNKTAIGQLQEMSDQLVNQKEFEIAVKKEIKETKEFHSFQKSENVIFSTELTKISETLHRVSEDVEKIKMDFASRSASVVQTESSKETIMEKLLNKVTDVDDRITKELDKISQEKKEINSNNVTESFCVYWDELFVTDAKKDQIVQSFSYSYNLLNTQLPHYNQLTGLYTAPYDGIYIVSVMIENRTVMKVQFNVCSKDQSEEKLHAVCGAMGEKTSPSVAFPVILVKDEQLYLKYFEDYEGLKLGRNTTFSCILVKQLRFNL